MKQLAVEEILAAVVLALELAKLIGEWIPTTRLVKFGLQFSLEPVILRNMT